MSQAQVLPADHFSPSVFLSNSRPATNSIAIAEHFGKRHDDVLKSIRKLCSELPDEVRARNFAETSRTVAGPNNSERQEKFFTVYFDGFILLVMGYTGKKALAMKLAYIAAFNAMREQLAGKALPTQSTPSTADDRKPLRALVHAWAQVAGVHHAALEKEIDDACASLFHHAISDLGRNADTMFSPDVMTEAFFLACSTARPLFDEALHRLRLHLRLSLNVAVMLGR